MRDKAKIATLQIQAIAVDIGILIVAGVIKELLITTVSCNRHDFVWILTDTTNTMHRKNVTGASYYTYDTVSKKTRAYFDGYTPRD